MNACMHMLTADLCAAGGLQSTSTSVLCPEFQLYWKTSPNNQSEIENTEPNDTF